MDDKILETLRLEFPSITDQDIQRILEDLEQYYSYRSKKHIVSRKEREAVCDLWLQIFGTQPGVGCNCPRGAYDFAEIILKWQKELFVELLMKLHKEANGDHNYYLYAANKIEELNA